MDKEEKPKGQSLEFFITYIWAIMVIMAGLGILVYFGIIDAERSICKVTPQLKCTEIKVEPDRIFFTVENNLGNLLLGVDVGVDGCTEMDRGNMMDKDTKQAFIISGCNNNQPGYKLDTNLNFTYTLVPRGISSYFMVTLLFPVRMYQYLLETTNPVYFYKHSVLCNTTYHPLLVRG